MTTATMTVNAKAGVWLPGYEIRVDLASGRVLCVTPERPQGVAADDESLPQAIVASMTEEAAWQLARLREQIDAD